MIKVERRRLRAGMFIDPWRAFETNSHSKNVEQDTCSQQPRDVMPFAEVAWGLIQAVPAWLIDSHAYQPGDGR